VIANRFGNKSAEASCLGEHEVAVSGRKKFVSRRFQNLTEPHKPFSEAQTYSGARLRYAPLSQDTSAKKLSRIVTE